MSGDLWRRIRTRWLDRRDLEREVDEELEFHIAMRAAELVDAEGVGMDEARARATAAFGDADATRRRYVARRALRQRTRRVRALVDDLRQDVRFGARSLWRRPAFAGTALCVLALGIGAPTTVFTMVETLFFERPAHVSEPGRLVRVFRAWNGGAGGSLQHPDYRYYRDNNETLSGLAAYGGSGIASYRFAAGEPDQLRLLHVSSNYFGVLGVPMARGRAFAAAEGNTRDAGTAAVVSHAFWRRAMGADPDAIGATIQLNGIMFEVIGVAPDGFRGISPVEATPDAWVPISMFGALRRLDSSTWWDRDPRFVSRWLDLVGRLADGVAFEVARANLESLNAVLDYDGRVETETVVVTRQFLYRPSVRSSLAAMSRVLLAVVAVVLLIAVANVTVLLLSRATARGREIGIRTAIGAGRGRLVRQLLVESLLLGAAGGALGVGLAYVSVDVAAGLIPFPVVADFTVDGRVVTAAVGLTLLTAFAVGLTPALLASSGNVRSAMQEGATPRVAGRLRAGLVVAQVALSLVLVAGATLFARSFWAAHNQDLGFDRDGILIAGTDLRVHGYDAGRSREFVREALERVAAVPGVTHVSSSRQVPFAGDWSTVIEAPPGSTPTRPDGMIQVGLNEVAPDYFAVMGIPVLAGRTFAGTDDERSVRVAVINEHLAEALWPGVDALGRHLPTDDVDGPIVVGVVRDATYYELGEETWAQAYVSALQRYPDRFNLFVRSSGDASVLAAAVQAALRELEPRLAFDRVTTMASVVEDELGRYEVTALLVGLFGGIALLLAAVGLYGVVSFLVSSRTREIGVRMALGADRRRVAEQVLQSGLRLAGGGVLLGLAGAWAARGLADGMLYQVDAGDLGHVIAACVVLVAVSALASAGPARRATRVDPIEAMRVE